MKKKHTISFILLASFIMVLLCAVFLTHKLFKDHLYTGTLQNTVIGLDNTSFHNKTLFKKASLIAAESIHVLKKLTTSTSPIQGMTVGHDNQVFYTDGKKIYSVNHEVFSLPNGVEIVALAKNPLQNEQFLALTAKNQILKLNIQNKKVAIEETPLEVIPSNVKVEEMWVNPVNYKISIITQNGRDSQILEVPMNQWNQISKQVVVPNIILTGGLDLSLNYKALLTKEGNLYIMRWDESEIVHIYKMETQEIMKTTSQPYDIDYANGNLFMTRENPKTHQFEIVQLDWKIKENLLVINDTIKSQNDKLSFEWKFFSEKHSLPTYFVDLLLRTNDLSGTSILGMGPLKNSSVEIPINTPLSEIKGASAHPLIGKMTLSEMIQHKQNFSVKIAAIDKKGRGIASIKGFNFEANKIDTAPVPSVIQDLFLTP